MLRVIVLAGMICCLTSAASAQTADGGSSNGETIDRDTAAVFDDGPVDFLLRGTSQADGTGQDADPFGLDDTVRSTPPGRPQPDPNAPIGPPLAGPETATGSIGPPLHGPGAERDRDSGEPDRRRPINGEDGTDPFEAPGVRLGTFIVRPQLEIGVEVTDNVAGGAEEVAAVGARVASSVAGESDWSRHQVAFELRGSAIRYDDPTYDDSAFDAALTTRLDVTGRTAIETEASYQRSLDSFTDPDTPGAAAARPAVHEYGADLGLVHTGNTVAFAFRAGIEHERHDEVALTGGGTADLSDQDHTEVWGRARVTLVRSQRIRPFVETAVGRIEHDRRIDSSGFRRDRDWAEVSAGVLVDLGPKLSGELEVGFRRDMFGDPALADIEAVNVAGELVWSPVRLTEVRLGMSTETEGSTQAGVSGSVTRAADLTLTRRFNNRLTGSVGLGLTHQTFTGVKRTDITADASSELAYAISRFASIVGRYTYTRVESDDPDTTGDEHRAEVFVRVQR